MQRLFSQRSERVKGVDIHPTEPWCVEQNIIIAGEAVSLFYSWGLVINWFIVLIAGLLRLYTMDTSTSGTMLSRYSQPLIYCFNSPSLELYLPSTLSLLFSLSPCFLPFSFYLDSLLSNPLRSLTCQVNTVCCIKQLQRSFSPPIPLLISTLFLFLMYLFSQTFCSLYCQVYCP